MTEDKPSDWVEDLGEILDEAGVQVTFTGWKKELEAEEQKNKLLEYRLAEAEALLKECDSIIKVSKHYIEDGAEIELQNAAKVLEKLKAFREKSK